jgi:hypothetical protein
MRETWENAAPPLAPDGLTVADKLDPAERLEPRPRKKGKGRA